MLKYAYHINDIFVNHKTFDISRYNEDFLLHSVQRRCELKGYTNIEEYIEFLEDSGQEKVTFYNSLQIGYSSFFRNPLTFNVIEKIILPKLALKNSNSKGIRVWSTACAAGQEVYSMAILLHEQNLHTQNDSSFILATDKNEHQLILAKEGRYLPQNIENVTFSRMNKWFTQVNQSYQIHPSLQQNVKFSPFDLFDDVSQNPYLSVINQFDIILCTNVLLYYKEKYQKVFIEKLVEFLPEDGYIVLGETEKGIAERMLLNEIFPYSGIYKK